MACYWKYVNETEIHIPEVEENDAITYYKIEVKISRVKWYTSRRYSEFFDMHQILCNDHGVTRTSLPPKRTIRNKCPQFIETRRKTLQEYLQNIFHYLKRTMPRVFIEFLEFHIYETFYVLKDLAFKLCTSAVTNFAIAKPYYLNLLEVIIKFPFTSFIRFIPFSYMPYMCVSKNHFRQM